MRGAGQYGHSVAREFIVCISLLEEIAVALLDMARQVGVLIVFRKSRDLDASRNVSFLRLQHDQVMVIREVLNRSVEKFGFRDNSKRHQGGHDIDLAQRKTVRHNCQYENSDLGLPRPKHRETMIKLTSRQRKP